MIFDKPVYFGKLIKRYKRFLADIKLDDGNVITAHCANSGSMKTCDTAGWRVLVSDSLNPKRKLRYTFEMIHNEKCWIGINTQIPNKLAKEAIESGIIKELQGYDKILPEQKYGVNSRIDLLLTNAVEKCFVEVKSVTLVQDGDYQFPDSVTARGLKHLNELLDMKKQGHRAVMLFIIQRSDGNIFKPAKDIDPKYSQRLREVYKDGVEVLVYLAKVSPEEIVLSHKIDFVL
ncbi:MAG: DNA/RNA nuclease SfsA [Calditrichaeota bacterium]|nr:MAG: DNA/RNA nuclease SfsA [Calditrichota bacterium]MBL1205518.1 DNA/RNA nuclease SfsA [Calditrichota bacterium]NOG45346.1 DNA/RNA nuclease SfsA [Calditrichota bacterium]